MSKVIDGVEPKTSASYHAYSAAVITATLTKLLGGSALSDEDKTNRVWDDIAELLDLALQGIPGVETDSSEMFALVDRVMKTSMKDLELTSDEIIFHLNYWRNLIRLKEKLGFCVKRREDMRAEAVLMKDFFARLARVGEIERSTRAQSCDDDD